MAVYGPDNATLTVHTGKTGAAAKAGHNLTLEVTRWEGALDDDSLTLTADARSLRVVEGEGGMAPLGDEEKASIAKTIDDEVLEGTPIAFRSTRVSRADGRIDVEGELELAGVRGPLAFTLDAGGGLSGSATFKQSDWKMKPYSALFGTLKVADAVEVRITTRSANG